MGSPPGACGRPGLQEVCVGAHEYALLEERGYHSSNPESCSLPPNVGEALNEVEEKAGPE